MVEKWTALYLYTFRGHNQWKSLSVCSIPITGWVSIGSLDGFLYSFSPTGILKKFPKADAQDSVLQFSPLLDCSGYAVYVSQTVMDGKISHIIGEYNYISALKPVKVVFTLLVPATGSIYWSESYPGNSDIIVFKYHCYCFKHTSFYCLKCSKC